MQAQSTHLDRYYKSLNFRVQFKMFQDIFYYHNSYILMLKSKILFIALFASLCSSCLSQSKDLSKYQKAYFAAGCFWCVEAIYESLNGVEEVISGYSGGKKENAHYDEVGSGVTKHAETVEVYYDQNIISYETLVKVFFLSHDPTTLNRQGPDIGTQYRSILFYQDKKERSFAKEYIKSLQEGGKFKDPIVTELTKFESFYPAEDHHQNYERNNPQSPYVKRVSIPRLIRAQKLFPELLKPEKNIIDKH